MLEALAWIAFAFAVLPLGMGVWNLRLLQPPGRGGGPEPKLSVLVPARNEAARIEPLIRSVLASEGVTLELIVADDQSTDGTAAVVQGWGEQDARVGLVTPPPPPAGRAGKMNACLHLAREARHHTLVFLDADVTLAPDGLRRVATFLEQREIGLASGFPRQVTKTMWERVTIPWIYVLLAGYLPMIGMRRTMSPAFGAACGQFMMFRKDAYWAVGGHAAMDGLLHDGVQMPRILRRAGIGTDLFDATRIADCRMYDNFTDIWRGFSKNATEGMARMPALVVWTALLFFGHVAPFAMLPVALFAPSVFGPALGGCVAVLLFRILITIRFQQDWPGVATHPFGALVTLAIQWAAWLRARSGRPVEWKGRRYDAAPRA